MSDPLPDEEACKRVLIDGMAEMGVEVYVSPTPPDALMAYPPNPMTCPHGTTFYMQPTTKQIEAWEAERVP